MKQKIPPRLGEVKNDQWVKYFLAGKEHRGGGKLRWAQMDLVIEGKRSVVIGECKLTQQRAGRQELERLYLPLARLLWPGKQLVPVMFFLNSTESEYEEGDVVGFVKSCLTRELAQPGVIDFRVDRDVL